jgi:hypothetical protein
VDQERARCRPLTAGAPLLLAGILFVLTLQAWLDPAAADKAPAANVPLCSDVIGQDGYAPDIKKMIEAAPGGSARRLAIVIGNDYPRRPKPDGTFKASIYAVPELKNAAKDATAIASLLMTLQFKVACFLNVSAKFHDRIVTASTTVGDSTNALTLYYYAGHGYAIGQESFSVGDGAERDSMETLRMSSVSQSKILAGLHSREAPVIAILDMCRSQLSIVDAEGHRAPNEKSLDGYQRISKVPGLLVHYSTSQNEYAADLPAQPNGLYARVFLEQTPAQPGLSAEQLLNDVIGKVLADGLQIDGKTYQQFPSLVAYPDDWTKIQIFDAASASKLDQVMSAAILLDMMVANGHGAIAHACRMAIDIRDEWKAAPDPAGSKTTVAQLLDRIGKLLQKMKDKGFPCPDILLTKNASSAVTLPPLAHVAKTSVVLSAAGQTTASSYDLAKAGTWLATNSVSLPINVTKAGTFATIAGLPAQLDSAFVSSSKVAAAPAASDVYFTPIDRGNAKLVNTKDQIVVRFQPGEADIMDPDKVVGAIKRASKSATKLVFILLPPNKPREKNYLDRLRLSSVRELSVIRQIVRAGIPYGQIIAPGADQQPPIEISTLLADEALIKVVGTSSPAFEALGVDTLNPTSATGAAKHNLEVYETMTKFTIE